jgi:acetyl-CoA/propionyl-CoA carboxylase biotin carboxyl carrier protein
MKLLIANRGEIAVRIARTARDLGMRTVAVFSDADEHALHVDGCDEAIRLGPAPARDSYLAIEKLLDAARRTGADAVHPGYGFLAESAAFAQAVIDAGLTWVGPPPAAIDLLGDKARAKALAREAGVPVVPGIDGDDVDIDAARTLAAEHGYPIVVKALAGGGGKGMRVVRAEEELGDAFAAARREAQAAFGDDRVLVERYLERPRHIEVQVLADAHGACVHLGERECSLQRRHQKVIEEAPSPAFTTAMRAAMGDAAVALTRAAGYEGAGTVEFIVPADGDGFFFLEMNTRLQVEHPVTELVYGVDLVAQQLRVAQGAHLDLAQGDLLPRGWAVEARIYAEDPAAGFLPSTGEVAVWRAPGGPGVRVDAGVRSGSTVTSDYDPMLAKVIAHGEDRAEAIDRLDRALADLVVLGVRTSVGFSRTLLADSGVRSGAMDTGLLERRLADVDHAPPEDLLAAAALAAFRAETTELTVTPGPWRARFADHGEVEVRDGELRAGGRTWTAHTHEADGALRAELDGHVRRYAVAFDAAGVWVARDGHQLHLRREARPRTSHAFGGAHLEAPMPGTVLLVHVQPGDTVAEGDVLLVLESMKMELAITAPHDGVVESLDLAPGDRVVQRQDLVVLAAADVVSAGADTIGSSLREHSGGKE